jgi:16S rRNA (cytosine967-C5)-methyltransferase
MPVSPARTAAFEILMRIETTDAYASELLHSSRFAKLSPADHRLLTELVMGVLRWRGLLDEMIAERSRQAIARLDLEVLTALRLGAYQILFLDRVPKHAAVNESVELVKRAHKRSATGLVNAVLRKIDRNSDQTAHFSEEHGQVERPEGNDDKNSHPFARTAKRVGQPAYISTHPGWLVQRWDRIYGADAMRKICDYDQSEPAMAIHRARAKAVEIRSTGQTGAAGFTRTVDDYPAEGIQLEPGKLLSRAFTVKSGDVTRTNAFLEHRLVIQDEASQLVALLVGNGKAILDCCAAPGGKTRILAQENSAAAVIAMELHPRRATLLKKLASEPNVRIISADVRAMPIHKQFDRILVDAPCSGTGTLARNPEIKWRLKAEDLLRLQAYQLELLRSAMKHVAVGGRIVYSTCSLEPEENEQVIEKALAENSEFRVIDARSRLLELRSSGELVWRDIDSLISGPYLRTLPGVHPCDGFFAAIIEKT